jgi:hypothetical protein
MVPDLEDMGIQMLLNENHVIERGNQRIYLAGIDDAHFYRVDNIEKAATGIPFGIFRSCCRTRQRFTSRHPMPTLACIMSRYFHAPEPIFRGSTELRVTGMRPGETDLPTMGYRSRPVQLPTGNHTPSPFSD